MSEVAGATTLPILMLGGDPSGGVERIFDTWEQGMKEPNVRGLLAGRTLLYPPDGDIEAATARALSIVRPHS
jgi:hypothetical protein